MRIIKWVVLASKDKFGFPFHEWRMIYYIRKSKKCVQNLLSLTRYSTFHFLRQATRLLEAGIVMRGYVAIHLPQNILHLMWFLKFTEGEKERKKIQLHLEVISSGPVTFWTAVI